MQRSHWLRAHSSAQVADGIGGMMLGGGVGSQAASASAGEGGRRGELPQLLGLAAHADRLEGGPVGEAGAELLGMLRRLQNCRTDF